MFVSVGTLAGATAYGLIVAALSHPFETLKVRAQTQHACRGELYSGVFPATAASVAFRSVPFVGYEAASAAMSAHRLLQGRKDA